MINKKHANSGQSQRCSNPLHLAIIIVLAVLLIVSGYFNYSYYKFYKSYKNSACAIMSDRDKEIATKYIGGQIKQNSGDTIGVEDYTTKKVKTIKITPNTKITGVQMTFDHVTAEEMQKLQNQVLSQSDLKIGDNAQVLLVGTIADKELVAQEITVTK